MAEKKTRYGDRKWREELYVEVYKLARCGKTDAEICAIIGVGRGVFDRWRKEKPAFQRSLDDGRDLEEKKQEAVERLYSRLTPELQEVWDRIVACEIEDSDHDKEVIKDKRRLRIKIDDEIAKMELKARQGLFIFAYVGSDFNKTEACRLVGVSMDEFRSWAADKQFKKLLDGCQEAKKDLCESALMGLVKQGEPSAVVFANKTLNRDRGYNDKVENNLNVNVHHSVDDLGLSLEDRKKLLEAIRQRQALPHREVLEVEAR